MSSRTVTVVNDVTGEPLGGVSVSPYYDAVIIRPRFDEAVTDANGRATLDLAWGSRYHLTFRLPNGQSRSVWLPMHSGSQFRIWPEPYRRVTIVVPDRYRGLLYVRGPADSYPYGLEEELVAKDTPRFELADGLVASESNGLAVLKENGIAKALQLESVRYVSGPSLPVEKWFGPTLEDVAARPIGLWNSGPDSDSYVFCIGTAEEARAAAEKLYRTAAPQRLFSSTKSFTVQHRYFDADLKTGSNVAPISTTAADRP